MKKLIFYLSILPLFAGIFPYLACYFLDTPTLHGFFSIDAFILLSLLLLPKKTLIPRALWALILCLFALFYTHTFETIVQSGELYQNTNTITAFVYILIVLISVLFPDNRYFKSIIYSFFCLLLLVLDSSNISMWTYQISLGEVWSLAKFFSWGILLFFAIPLLYVVMCVLLSFNFFSQTELILKKTPVICFLTFFCILFLNLSLNSFQNRERLISTTFRDYMNRYDQDLTTTNSSYLREDIKREYKSYQSTDTIKCDTNYSSIVMVLVESWGVPKNIELLKYSFSFFDDVPQSFKGLYLRNVAYTQGAEWEDFNMPQGKPSDFTLPKLYQNAHYETWYLHGYDGDFYERKINYPALGFDSLLFRTELFKRGLKSCKYGYPGICDTSTAAFIAEILSDSSKKHFIYWTTLDAHYPYSLSPEEKESDFCKDFNLNEAECAYYSRQSVSLKTIASLAKKFPRTRFIVRGDHRPMGANTPGFVSSFYHRWVPMLILN